MFLLSTDISSQSSLPLYKVFIFWLSILNKLLNLLKNIYIFPGVSYFHIIIAFIVISIFVTIVKFGLKTSSDIRYFDSTITYWNKDNPDGYKSFGKSRRTRKK